MIEFIAGFDCGANAAIKGNEGCKLDTKCMTKDKSAVSALGANADDKCACNKLESFVEDDARPGWCVPAKGKLRYPWTSLRWTPYLLKKMQNAIFKRYMESPSMRLLIKF